MAETKHGHAVLTGPEQMGMFHLLQLKGALKLECAGIKIARRSVCAYVKQHLGMRGSREKVLAQLEQYIEDVKSGKKIYRGYGGEERSPA